MKGETLLVFISDVLGDATPLKHHSVVKQWLEYLSRARLTGSGQRRDRETEGGNRSTWLGHVRISFPDTNQPTSFKHVLYYFIA